MLSDRQLDWLAKRAGWQIDRTRSLPYWRDDEYMGTNIHPSTSCDQLIEDHDAWMMQNEISYSLQRLRPLYGGKPWLWVVSIRGFILPKADTPAAALARAFYHARGGPE